MADQGEHQIPLDQRAHRFLAGLIVLGRNPASAKFARAYLRSLVSPHSTLEQRVPWLAYTAIAWLDSQLEPGMRVFEYGSGGSTLFFASRVRDLVSVEHDRTWHAWIAKALTHAGIDNCTYLLREAERGINPRFASTDAAFVGTNFENYVRAIDNYPDGSFDLVAVDGRARAACVHHALPKVRAGGYLLLDDSDRPAYGHAVERLSECERLDFTGAAPDKTDPAQTTVWKIERAQ